MSWETVIHCRRILQKVICLLSHGSIVRWK
jgi:hypothetical protein